MPSASVRLYTYGKVVGCTGDEVTVRSVELNPRMFTFSGDVDTFNDDGRSLADRYLPGTMAMLTVDQEVAGRRQKRVVAAVPQSRFERKQLGGTVVWIGQPNKGENAGKSVAVVELRGTDGTESKALLTPMSKPNASQWNRLYAISESSGGSGYSYFYQLKQGDKLELTCFPMPAIRADNSHVYPGLWCPQLDGVDHFAFTYEPVGRYRLPNGGDAGDNAAQTRAQSSTGTGTPSPLPDMSSLSLQPAPALPTKQIDAGTQSDDVCVTAVEPSSSASSGDANKHMAELRRATMESRQLFELLHTKLSSEFMFNLLRADQ